MKKWKKILFITLFLLVLILVSVKCNNVDSVENTPESTVGFAQMNQEKGDGLTLIAVLDDAVSVEDKRLVFNTIYALSDHQVVVYYSLIDTFYIDDTDVTEDNTQKDYLISYDFNTETWGTPLDITAEEDAYNYIEYSGLLWVWNVGAQYSRVTGYDGSLCAVKAFSTSADTFGTFSPDGEKFYYISDGSLFCTDTDQGMPSAEKVTFDTAFSPKLLLGVFQNEAGENYGLLGGIAGDLKYYSAAANLETGRMLYMNPDMQDIIYIENGLLVDDKSWTGESLGGKYRLYSGGRLYEYSFPAECVPYLQSVGDSKVLFVETDYEDTENGKTDFRLWLYDGIAGRKLGSAALSAGFDNAFISQAIPYPGEDALLLCVMKESAETLNAEAEFYRWEYGRGLRKLNDPIVTAEAFSEGMLGEIDSEWDLDYFTPGVCPPELDDLRQQADQLEEKFGVKIKISDECKSIRGDYAITAMSDREEISKALSRLEYELSKYPEKFFQQFIWEGVDGIDIYLAGTLLGMVDNSLDIGGGFTTEAENRLLLVLDCTDADSINTTLHHEIAHAIDRKLQSDYEHILLDESEWEALNPFPDMYTYSYRDYMERDYEEEGLFEYIYLFGTDKKKICFMDIYALTYPTEDRARIFEYAMSDDYDSMWTEYPRLRAKLDFFAERINRGFDTSGWGKVRWDKAGDVIMQ